MGRFRLAIIAVAAFTATFAGISFAARTLPSMNGWAARPVTLPPVAEQIPAPAPPPMVVAARPDAPTERPSPSPQRAPTDRAAVRDMMRGSALQAARAYAQSPCEPAAKAAFVVAASTYLGLPDADSAADRQARDAIRTAIDNGGLGSEDFPSHARALAPSAPRGAGAACAPSRQAESSRR